MRSRNSGEIPGQATHFLVYLFRTAPGSKVWDYDYNALGQVTSVSIPNGMTTVYSYDTRNRLTKIEHKDGANVLDGWTYALDDQGNITRTDQAADSSYWTYAYDSRYRLTSAHRYNSGASIDAADNLLSKTEPFLDDLEDGNLTGLEHGQDQERHPPLTAL